jgi:hypothetical protein
MSRWDDWHEAQMDEINRKYNFTRVVVLLFLLAFSLGLSGISSCRGGDALLPVRTANNALVAGIEAAGEELKAQITKNAQEQMALCNPLPDSERAECRERAVDRAIEQGTPVERKLKKITLLQWVIADAIQAYDNAQDADKEEAAQVLLSQLPLLVQAQHDVEELVKGGL